MLILDGGLGAVTASVAKSTGGSGRTSRELNETYSPSSKTMLSVSAKTATIVPPHQAWSQFVNAAQHRSPDVQDSAASRDRRK
mgnify:CR=1 FL=1